MARKKDSDQPISGAIHPPVKTGVTLSAEAHRRLSTASLVDGQTFSEIMEHLINTHLTHYFSGKRAKAGTGEAEEAA